MAMAQRFMVDAVLTAKQYAYMLKVIGDGAAPIDGIAIPLFRWRRQVLVPMSHPAAERGAPNLKALSEWPLLTYESANFPASSLRRTFEAVGLTPQLAMTAHDADLIKTYVRAGLGVGVVAEMAVNPLEDTDLRVWPAPAELPECVTWAVVPRGDVLRDYTRSLLLELAPQLDRHDLRRVIDGVQSPPWSSTPSWTERSRTISV